MQNDYDGALEKAVYYRDLFGRENFFIELQDHGIEEEQRILPGLARIAAEAGVGMAATNDSHYIEKEDSRTHGILLCIQTGSTVSDENKMEFQTDEFYLKTEDEMRALFGAYPEAIENTQKIADRCQVTFTFGERKLPRFDVPNGENHLDYFRRSCYEGLHRHYGQPRPSADRPLGV